MATIRQVATAAGVSFKTVSRVVNKDPNVAAATAAKVKKAIEDLGYHPNVMARGLAKNRTFLIGLVIPEVSSAAFSLMIEGIEREAELDEHHLVLCTTGSQREVEEATVSSLVKTRRVDGILLVSNRTDTAYFQSLKGLDVPVVVVDRRIDDDEIPQVYTNNSEGVRQATSHLVDCGRRRIIYLTPVINTSTSQERIDGYRRAMSERALDFDGTTTVSYTAQRSQGRAAMADLLSVGARMDAVVAFNDLLAIGAMEAIKARGMKIPEDIAVAGFDDIEAASMVEPALTTVRQPLDRIGSAACRLLLDLAMGRQPETRRLVFDTELIVRGSTVAGKGANE